MNSVTATLVFVAGLGLGTLLNVIIIRLPREGEIGGWPRCTRCGRSLAAWQFLPLAGWLAQAGRGRCCGRRLHWIFPLTELLTAAALVLFYLRYGLTGPFFYLSFVTAVLLVTAAIDWLHRYIYTLFILGPALLILIIALLVPLPNHSFADALAGALIAGFVFVLLFIVARMLFPAKAAPFGLGDVYLGIFIGAAVGITNLLPALFFGILLAGVFAAALVILKHTGRPGVSEYISYGTFLCLGALGYLLVAGLQGI